MYGEHERCLQVLVVKPDRKEPLGRPKLQWADNIKIDLLEVVWEVRTRFIWLRVGKGGGHLCMW